MLDSPLLQPLIPSTRPSTRDLVAQIEWSTQLCEVEARLLVFCNGLGDSDFDIDRLPKEPAIKIDLGGVASAGLGRVLPLVLQSQSCRTSLATWLASILLPIGVVRNLGDIELPGPWGLGVICWALESKRKSFWLNSLKSEKPVVADAAFLGLHFSRKALGDLAKANWSPKGRDALRVALFQRALLDGKATAEVLPVARSPHLDSDLIKDWLSVSYLRGLRRSVARAAGKNIQGIPRWLFWPHETPVPRGLAVMALEWLVGWQRTLLATNLADKGEAKSRAQETVRELVSRTQGEDLWMWYLDAKADSGVQY